MCGFAGAIGPNEHREALREAAQALQDALRHRGPDGRGIYLSENYPVALVHTRLAILDLSPAGHQPMATADGRYWIAFNGEIYNFRALRKELEAKGVTFRTGTDTEVILQLYAREGAASLQRLRGMFAFAIWDEQEKSLFLARDPLGIKPLYYWQGPGGRLYFASEVRALLATGAIPRRLSTSGLYSYILRGHVLEPKTLVEGIHSLSAGTWMHWQDGVVRRRPYHRVEDILEQAHAPGARRSGAAELREALNDSVKHHFESDVPVGIFLSGGLDSSSILSLARRHVTGDLHTFSIGFEEREYDESSAARRLSERYGTKHHEWKMTANEGRTLFAQFADSLDQPSVDGFNTFCVSRFAHDQGTKVVLSGLGGDELFGSYPGFRSIPQMMRWGRALSMVPPLQRMAAAALRKQRYRGAYRRLGDFLMGAPSLRKAYRCYRGVFEEREAAFVVRSYQPGAGAFAEGQDELPSRLGEIDIREAVSYFELTHYMRSQLLRDSDSMSMANGLELRVPMVDTALLATVLAVPPSQRYRSNKRALTEAVGDLPAWLLTQPKRGFSFPLQNWLPREWKEEFAGIHRLYGEKIPLVAWARPFSLWVLSYWAERHLGVQPQAAAFQEAAELETAHLQPFRRSSG